MNNTGPSSRFRGADHSPRSGRRAVSAAMLLVIVLILVYLLFPAPETPRFPRTSAQRRFRAIEAAVAKYLDVHGHLPFDERGAAHALYRLQPFVEAELFQVFDSGPAPFWDHQGQRLRGGDVVYLNQRLTGTPESQLFMFVRPKPGANWTYAAYTGSWTAPAYFRARPDERVLGSLRTVDNFHVVGTQLFGSLAATHVEGTWATSGNSGRGPNSASVGNRSLKYQYDDGRVRSCTITTKKGTVTEQFTTDGLGQITAVTRSPQNWAEILAR